MGLRESVSQLFKRAPVVTTTTTAQAGSMSDAQSAHSLAHRFGAETERAQILDICQRMYKNDPRIKKMHRQLARDIVKGGYILRCQDKRALEVAKALQERLKLNQKLDDYVRLAARDGDLFLQIEISERMQIVDVSRKPVKQMRRNSNNRDQFDDASRAY